MAEETWDKKRAQMRKGLLEFCILEVISEKRAFSSDILDVLKRADLLVVEGTIYPMLSRLKEQGLVSYDWEESSFGPPRKYYELTQAGRKTLDMLEETWGKLQGSIKTLMKK
jgi:PadR family transcriptional regulator PadR